ncbi:MAG: SIS domain-containing protein [Cystobacterineae bacterium]|nr:SIS domain-containing protein [Cystobacterineae bacterium]
MHFEHHMLREIKEQPAVLAALAKRGQLLLEKDGGGLFGFDDPEGASFQRILFLSCGSSYHASLAGKWMVETFAGLCCQVEYAHEYRLSPPLPLENCLVVGLSQSGETLDTLEAMRKAKQAGARILSICNVANSTAISLAHTAFLLEAGPEKAVASTKVVSAQLAAVFLLALRLGIAHGRLPQEFVQKHVQNLMDIPNQLSTVLQNDSFSKEVALALHEAKQLLIVGKGLAYAIALEGALKLKETCYLHAEAFAGGEFRHGPMALVEPTVPTLLLMPSLPQESFELMQGTAREIRERAGPLWVLTQKRPETLGEADAQLYFLPQADAFLSTFLFLAPLQTLAYHLAHGRGLNVDSPRGLCKAVVADP